MSAHPEDDITYYWDHIGRPSQFVVKKRTEEIYRGNYPEGYALVLKIRGDANSLRKERNELLAKLRALEKYYETSTSIDCKRTCSSQKFKD